MSLGHGAYPTYAGIGLRPLINCRGTYTIIGGSLILPEARAAMLAAAEEYVDLDELMEAVGARLAELMQAPWGLVTNGCAAALCQVTAACVAGTDRAKMTQLPDTTGMPDQVVTQTGHRHVYDHAIRMVGVEIVEVGSREEMAAAIGDRTAMVAFFGDATERGPVSLAETVEIAHGRGIPVLVDAAAERPDIPNWYLGQGADAVAYSGGKCLRGPQASGLVLGRKDLLQAAFANGAPHHSLGRPMKAGKEEIMGLLAAVEQWTRRDHEAEWLQWEKRLGVISDAVDDIPTVTTSVREPGRSNVAPVLSIDWDEAAVGKTGDATREGLSAGEPRIELFAHGGGITVMPYMMEPGQERIVAHRIREELTWHPAESA
ncbi:aminotransferase class V-fold PLP-dependent enzyme [Candidatus Poribacteria bacterium]|jgi:D-glucosaminate-6-phosphate ammonia-lyase|nr:aminotransferase class V-fold PLP-dependent enzyme [Candidatus Poribacteria bacterium]MBT5535102.1 aminotransferase class V-fold PLP-dependent enzyme [Candidatus Poribacteria bacterium]MBT7097311.1 aminotransferase class V-fold PLP-dependent enzyme [Candidatus Poribacteria bacterium]MBT7805027.1 aminotransferase class V-fold PLP-dependent enzyme [Candidatus Poribacteria bacterium]